MITQHALHHQTRSNYAYAHSNHCLHLRLRTLKGEVDRVWCRIGDPFIWKSGGADGGNLEGANGEGWSGQRMEMTLETTTEFYDYYFVSVPTALKRSRYAFILEAVEERLLFGERRIVDLKAEELEHSALDDLGNYFCFPYINQSDVLELPKWSKETVWYQIFPERFNNGDTSNDPSYVQPWGSKPTWLNYMGGDLQGVIDKLDYIEALGITGIHFCPLFKGDENHKYETLDYFQIDPLFGTNELFDELVNRAHEKNIKIMLDGVFNHLGYNHPFFQDVIKNGRDSKYFDWFYIQKSPVKKGHYETFATNSKMPRLNFDNEEVVQYFLEVGTYWIKQHNIDAWRIDVANEVSPEFWKRFRREIKKENPEVFILGEIWHNALPWLMGDQFDSVMNYPLSELLILYFAKQTINNRTFMDKTNALCVDYPINAMEGLYNILNTHDTTRFLTLAQEDDKLLILAYVFLFTSSGTPSIYYGDEIGLSGEKAAGKEDHRKCMPWDESMWNHHILSTIKKLTSIRKQNPELKNIHYDWNESGDEHLIVYRKSNIWVFLNRGHDAIEYDFNKRYKDLMADEESFNENLDGKIKIAPSDFRLIKV